MRLATAESLLSVLTIQASDHGLNSAREALDATFASVEELVESPLVRGTVTDTFVCTKDLHHPKLRLHCGFLTEDPLVVVVDGVVLPPGALVVDRRSGTVSVLVSLHNVAFARLEVTYTHGFAVPAQDAPDPTLLQDVPPVLRDIHLFLAASLLHTSPTNMPKDKAKTIGIHASRMYEAKGRMLKQQVERPRGLHLLPHTSATA